MRQVLLVIVLVGAAFGGGALVSGPGFRWAQEHLLDYMGLKDGGEIDTLDLAPHQADGKPVAEPIAGRTAATAMPSAVAPPPPAPAPKVTEPFTEAQAAAPASPPPPAPVPTAEPAKANPPALLGALNAMLTPPQAPAPPTAASSEPALADPALAPSSLPTLEAAPAPASSSAPPATAAGPGGEWAEIRRKLDAAGVSRYTIEGEPGGRVVFACLIPLAGKQAVSQRFEAEGEDEFQAAQAVLKRINLWRASHDTPETP